MIFSIVIAQPYCAGPVSGLTAEPCKTVEYIPGRAGRPAISLLIITYNLTLDDHETNLSSGIENEISNV